MAKEFQILAYQPTSALYEWVAYFLLSETLTQKYYRLAYSHICSLIHVYLKRMICPQNYIWEELKKKKILTIYFIQNTLLFSMTGTDNIKL